MGYAIFTARKLMLTNRINQINFRILQLSQQQQTLAKSAGDMERNMSWAKSMFSSMGNAFTSNYQMQMQMGMFALQQGGEKLDESKMQQLFGGMGQMNKMTMMFGLVGSIMDMQSQNELRKVKDMENQIELERKNLETQVKALSTERESVEKAEDNEIKNSAPKFA